MNQILSVILWLIIHSLLILIFVTSALGMPKLLAKRLEKLPRQMRYNQGKTYFWEKILIFWYVLCTVCGLFSLWIPNSFLRI